MPIKKQQGVLQRFDRYSHHTPETERLLWRSKACKWFMGEVMRLSGVENSEDIDRGSRFVTGNHQPIGNSDLHIDFRSSRKATKYVLTICNAPQSSTLFFPDADIEVHERSNYTSYNLFTRSNDTNLLIPKKHGIADPATHIQAPNGQIAEFDMGTDVHAAPPLPFGAQRILLYGVVRG